MPVRPPTYRPRGDRAQRERTPTYDQQRGTAAERGYDHRWRRASRMFLAANPLCRFCEQRDQITSATVVDHVIRHGGDVTLFWDETNWQPLCATCHSSVKQREEKAEARRRGALGNG